MDYRIESDTMGEIRVDNRKLWGAQTQRSLENFSPGRELMPLEVIKALTMIKKACAVSNNKLGILPSGKMEFISIACDEILKGGLDGHFPLSVWQTGSGTQTNMNVNEVISNYAIMKMGGSRGRRSRFIPTTTLINPSRPTIFSRPPCRFPQCLRSITNSFPQRRLCSIR